MATKERSKRENPNPRRRSAKTSPVKHAQTNAELRQQLAESLQRENATASENERLLNALTEALEHQTATAKVLSIISRSPTDVQPVLDAIVESAARVCGIDDVTLRLEENGTAVSRARFGQGPVGEPIPIREGGGAYRTIRLGETVRFTDMLSE